ncbi:MAG: outer membrane protein assembly factor BamA, partial [Nitrospirales bacterium]
MACALLPPVAIREDRSWAQPPARDGEPRIVSIDIRGNKRIEAPAIRGRLTLNVGDPYTAEAIRSQIRLIYDMGFFEDVRIETDERPGGVAVTFVVQEKPFVTEIVFDGNKELSEDKLREKITVRSQSFLDPQQFKESAEWIRSAYQEDGYFDAEVIPIIQTVEGDRKRLTFFIKEGARARIKTVVFEGRTAVKKKELLNVMATREWTFLLSYFTDAGILKREELANDVERIKEVYMNKGYLDVQVGLPAVDLTEDKKWFTVTFPIVEGQVYHFGKVTYRGHTVFSDEELRKDSLVVPGEIFQRAKLRDEKFRLEEVYGQKGYAFTEVNPSIEPDPASLTAAIAFQIKEGELIRIRQILITGNDKTRDNVIRRELRVNEQEVIDTAAMKRSFQRLNNLNFFETVEILPRQVSEDKVDLDVKVKEKPTGMFSIGGGFSTLDQFVAIADITEGNFLGRGWLVRVRGQLGQRRTLGLITFRDPYLFDSQTSLQVDVFRTRTNFLTYLESKTGGSVSFGRWFSEYVFGNVSLIAEELNITEVQDNAPQFVKDQAGFQSTTGFRTLISRDTRDYFLDPRTGMRNSLGVDYGTPALGGTNNFVKVQADTIKYWPLFWDTRFSIRGRFGIVEGLGGEPVPLTERFFVGGINTVRGFQFG